MKIAATVSRYLLGVMFTVFGLNGFLHFLPQQLPPSPLAQQFIIAAFTSHYMAVVFLVQLVAGVLLLAGLFVPLALAMLAPVLVNILDFHLTMDPEGIGPGLVATLLWLVLFFRHRASFMGILKLRGAEEPASRRAA
jgi:uncharacterized membrane protein YphA (DoxX/SURF4 family)